MTISIPQLPAIIKRQIPTAKAPIEWRVAMRAITKCRAIDEVKRWSDKSDALLAWSKLYGTKQDVTECKRTKLFAYRRMGELAQELQPIRSIGGGKGKIRAVPGPRALLHDHGLSVHQASAARRLAKMGAREFGVLMSQPAPPSPAQIDARTITGTSAWGVIGYPRGGLRHTRTWCRSHDARALARALSRDEAKLAREMAKEIIEWLDEFEQHLPKPAKKVSP